MGCTIRNCPAYAKCLAAYRGSRCKAIRASYDLGDPITNADRSPRPVVRGKNIGKDYAVVDQFVCSECGIEFQGWVRVERDEDTWEVTYHEYLFNYCPNCGAQVEGQR